MAERRDLIWFLSQQGQRAEDECWIPSADVYRTPSGWLVKVELPGVQPDEVEVELVGRELSVRGVRRDMDTKHCVECFQMELIYSRFERKILLPRDLGNTEVDCEFANGLLLIRLVNL